MRIIGNQELCWNNTQFRIKGRIIGTYSGQYDQIETNNNITIDPPYKNHITTIRILFINFLYSLPLDCVLIVTTA